MIKRNCIICNKEFEVLWNSIPQRYCSKQCWLDDLKSKRPTVNCLTCGKEFHPFPADIKRGKAKFCSIECKNKSLIKPKLELVCDGCGKTFLRLRYKLNGMDKHYCSQKCFRTNACVFSKMVGKNHPHWKGGHGREGRKYDARLKRWRTKILNRDKKCKYCGSTVRLEADHLWSFSIWPELKYKMWNGQTLCRKCHKATCNYGFRNNKFMHEIRERMGIPNRFTPPMDKILRIKQQILKEKPYLLQNKLL